MNNRQIRHGLQPHAQEPLSIAGKERRVNSGRQRELSRIIAGAQGKFLFALGISAMLLLFSCTRTFPGKILVRLENHRTQILKESDAGKTTLLADYPEFPALDSSFPRIGEYMIRFPNGNVIVVVPDNSVTEKIRAWNDQAHLFDVIFVDATKSVISTILKDSGVNIRIAKVMPDDGFVFQLDKNTCSLTLLDEKGTAMKKVKYQYAAYPDIVSVSKASTGYEIVHDNIDDTEKFLLDSNGGSMHSVSYSKHEQTK